MLREPRLGHLLHFGPLIDIQLVPGQIAVILVCQAAFLLDHPHKILVKFLLYTGHRVEHPVFRLVNAVKRCTTIQPVLPLLVVPKPNFPHTEYTLAQVNEILCRHINECHLLVQV